MAPKASNSYSLVLSRNKFAEPRPDSLVHGRVLASGTLLSHDLLLTSLCQVPVFLVQKIRSTSVWGGG